MIKNIFIASFVFIAAVVLMGGYMIHLYSSKPTASIEEDEEAIHTLAIMDVIVNSLHEYKSGNRMPPKSQLSLLAKEIENSKHKISVVVGKPNYLVCSDISKRYETVIKGMGQPYIFDNNRQVCFAVK